jgi:hypothetical protein
MDSATKKHWRRGLADVMQRPAYYFEAQNRYAFRLESTATVTPRQEALIELNGEHYRWPSTALNLLLLKLTSQDYRFRYGMSREVDAISDLTICKPLSDWLSFFT